jgi:hypothetical protein
LHSSSTPSISLFRFSNAGPVLLVLDVAQDGWSSFGEGN